MDAKQFLAEFRHIVSAPNGVTALRFLILNLAVSGRLTKQDSREQASDFLASMAQEREELITLGGTKRNKRIRQGDQQGPWVLPSNWKWARLGEFCLFTTGRTPLREERRYWNTGDYPWFSIADLVNGQIVSRTKETISEAARDDVFKRAPTKAGSLLMSFKLSIGKLSILGVDAYHNEAIISINPFDEHLKDYLFKCLGGFELTVENKAAIKGLTLNLDSISNIMLAVPPREEIPRIVAKVDELMALCDKLEAQQRERETISKMTCTAVLEEFSRVESNSDMRIAWNRLEANLPILLDRSEGVEQIKITILNLAVFGKLNLRESSVTESTLHKMHERKRILANKKVIKRETSVIDFPGVNELRTYIPDTWIWCRLNDIASVVRGGSPRPAGDPRFYGGDIPFLKVADVTASKGMFVRNFSATLKKEGLKKSREINKRTVLLTNSGATLGVPAICTFRTTFNDGIAAFIELAEEVFDEYLYFYLKAKSRWLLDIASRGQGQPNLNTDIIRAMWFPLPPVVEQRAIVDRLKKLLDICDQLVEKQEHASRIAQKFTSAWLATVTGIQVKDREKMKAPKTELVSNLRVAVSPASDDRAMLAAILARNNGQLSATTLWNMSNLEIDVFYQQLRTEILEGWIEEPQTAYVREAEVN